MKCPSCGTNHKYSAGMTCKCGYKFVFDPKTGKMTDNKFCVVLRRASAADTCYFTLNQLYAEYCRLVMKKPTAQWVGAAVSAALGLGLVGLMGAEATPLVFFAAVLTAIFLAVGLYRKLRRPPPFGDFETYVKRWIGQGRPLERLIREPQLHEPPPEWSEGDIYDYGVERVLIVERDILVDLLVKNNLHAEQRALVLAESGYPKYLLPVGRRLMTENPQLPVFLLHDATDRGSRMASRLRGSEGLPLAGHPVTDLGLSPDTTEGIGRLRFARRQDPALGVPLDFLPLAFLASGLGLALVEGLAFAELLAAKEHHVSTSFG